MLARYGSQQISKAELVNSSNGTGESSTMTFTSHIILIIEIYNKR